jgi:prolyl-tRNA synthetase
VCVVKDGEGVRAAAQQLVTELKALGVRVELDDRVDTAYGRRAVDWELKGVPTVLALGPRDLEEQRVLLKRRCIGQEDTVALSAAAGAVLAALAADQKALLDEARGRRESRTVEVADLGAAVEASGTGWARIPWDACGVDGEAKLGEDAVTVRCLVRPDGSVPDSPDEPDLVAVVARSY